MFRSEASPVAQGDYFLHSRNLPFTFMSSGPSACPSPGNPWSVLALWSVFFRTSNKWNPRIHSILCLVPFIQHCGVFGPIHVGGCFSGPFISLSKFHRVTVPQFLYPFTTRWAFWVVALGGPSRIKWLWTFACKSRCGHVLLLLLGDSPGKRSLAHMVTYRSLTQNPQTFPKWLRHFVFLLGSWESSSSSVSLLVFLQNVACFGRVCTSVSLCSFHSAFL